MCFARVNWSPPARSWRRRRRVALRRVLVGLALTALAGCAEKEPSDSTSPPSGEDTRIQIGLAFLADGDVEEGLEQFRAVSTEPGAAPSPTHLPTWFSPVIERLIQTRHAAEADSMLALLGPLPSRPPNFQYLSANVAVLQGRESEAIGIYESLTSHAELREKVSYELAMLHRYRGRHAQALSVARAELESNPDDEALRSLMIATLLDLDRAEEALEEARKLPLSMSRRALEGHAFLAMGKPDSAIVMLDQALRIAPHSTRVRYLLGWACVDAGQGERAVRALEPLAQPPTPYEDSQRLLARAFRLAGRTAAADSLDQVFDHAERLGRVRELRAQGLIHSRDGELEAALTALTRARELDPQSADLHNDLGAVLARLGRYEEAERELRHAEELRPDDPAVQQNLARLYALTGDEEKHAAALRKLESLLGKPE